MTALNASGLEATKTSPWTPAKRPSSHAGVTRVGSAVSTPTARHAWVDAAKGICVLMMVIGHVVGGLIGSQVVSSPESWAGFYAWKYAFNMPALFLLCGLFLDRSLQKGLGTYVVSRSRSLLYPHILWSHVAWVAVLLMYPFANSTYDLSYPTQIFYDPKSGMWTLITLFVCGVIFGALRKAGLSAAAVAVMAALGYVSSQTVLIDWPVVAEYLGHISWFGFWLVLGVVLSKSISAWQSRCSGMQMLAVSAMAFGATALVFAAESLHPIIKSFTLAAIGVVMYIGLAGWITSLRPNFATRLLGQMGRRSLEIYMLSAYGMVILRLVLMRVFGVENEWILLAVCTAGAIALPLFAVAILNRFRIGYVFRFGPAEPIATDAAAKVKAGSPRSRVTREPALSAWSSSMSAPAHAFREPSSHH